MLYYILSTFRKYTLTRDGNGVPVILVFHHQCFALRYMYIYIYLEILGPIYRYLRWYSSLQFIQNTCFLMGRFESKTPILVIYNAKNLFNKIKYIQWYWQKNKAPFTWADVPQDVVSSVRMPDRRMGYTFRDIGYRFFDAVVTGKSKW